jgi:hypothetical protein
MKCQICGGKTNWDSSVGIDEFIVCNPCVEKLRCDLHKDTYYEILKFIFSCGYIRREKEKSK